MTSKEMNNCSYLKIVKFWLTFILVLFPFQYKLVIYINSYNTFLANTVSRIDEVTIIVCFILAIIKYNKDSNFPVWLHFFWFIPIIFFGVSGLVSGIINDNSLYVTCFGIYDYIKYFFVIFIFAAFFRDFNEYKKVFRIIVVVAVFIGAVAVIEEFWALISKYILGSGFSDTFYYYEKADFENRWRFGIYRTTSFMSHYNQFGLYSLLILMFYLARSEKLSIKVLFFISAGVILSLSRTVYAGLLICLGAQFFQRKKKLIVFILLIPILLFVFSMSFIADFHIWDLLSGDSSSDGYYKKGIPFRVYASEKAMMVWGDNPFLGVGPGMFGGGIAKKFNTHLYEEYNFDPIMGGLDQFWPQILAEMGIVGAVAYAGIIISFLVTLFEFRRRSEANEVKNFFTSLIMFMIMLFIYSIGNRINVLDPILFTYFAFIGIGLGCIGKEYGK